MTASEMETTCHKCGYTFPVFNVHHCPTGVVFIYDYWAAQLVEVSTLFLEWSNMRVHRLLELTRGVVDL